MVDVRIQHVEKSFGQVRVLHGVTLDIPSGQVVCLLGPSGSGKSTLLRCVNGLLQVDRGCVLVGGELIGVRQRGNLLQPLNQKEASFQRRRIGMVFQSFNLFPHLTVSGNLALAGKLSGLGRDAISARCDDLLSRVELLHKKDAYPSALSGGQQQRVAIARALMLEPRLLLFDEPTSALDPELVGGVLSVLRDLANEGRTMIVVTHEIGFAREAADRIIFMADGEILEDRDPVGFFDRPDTERAARFLSMI